MVYPTEPPIELAEEPTFGPILRGQVANSRNTLFFTWARFRATASFRVTPGQSVWIRLGLFPAPTYDCALIDGSCGRVPLEGGGEP